MVPFKDRMQTCMRLSLDVCLGRSCGTIAVPCLDVTTSCGMPPPVGTIWPTLSTGAQSTAWQHSMGYQSWARAPLAPDAYAMNAVTKSRDLRRPSRRSSRFSMGARTAPEADGFHHAGVSGAVHAQRSQRGRGVRVDHADRSCRSSIATGEPSVLWRARIIFRDFRGGRLRRGPAFERCGPSRSAGVAPSDRAFSHSFNSRL
jgi:hypothetical protein